MKWLLKNRQKALDWLLESDDKNPSVRFFSLLNLLNKDAESADVETAQQKIMTTGPVVKILSNQQADGYWVEPGAGYRPKYTSTVWSVIMLAQLGADPDHPNVRKACNYVLDHTRAKQGFFSVHATQTGAVHCLQGNLVNSLIDLGMLSDDRLQFAINWMARSITGAGFGKVDQKEIDPHYIRSGINGPGFLCSANDHQPCAWGAVKTALALSKIPKAMQTPEIMQAIDVCKKFLLSVNPASAEYPHPYGKNPSGSWFKFGFPVFYVTDLLQNISALLGIGLAGDARLKDAIDLIESKQDEAGRWKMEYSYNGKTWVEIEEKKMPSKWVTYRALSVLKRFYS